jgi:phospholipase/lecithinase/hemolysin
MVPHVASAQLFRALFVFGDSLSDTGNVFRATTVLADPIPVSPPYFMGRFSNGPIWVETLAAGLGLEATPFLVGGTNFAYGGAEIALDSQDLFDRDTAVLIPSLQTQVRTFLAADFFGTEKADPAALYVVWGGANDIRDVLLTTGDPVAEAQASVDALAAAIEDLADAGAVYFLVPNLPNLGQAPETLALGAEAVAPATAVSVAFNTALTAALDTLEAEHRVVIFRLDVFSRLDDILANPTAFGFTNVTEACLAGDPFTGGTPCADPATHVFWDSIHPTTAGHALLATFAADVLPPLIMTRGEDSPGSVDVPSSAQALPVLQLRLGTGTDVVHLTQVTIDFTEQMGQARLVASLQVRFINDLNANGQVDAGEPVLATGVAAGALATLPVEITAPLDIPVGSTVNLLAVLDINSPTGAIAQAAVSSWRPGIAAFSRITWPAGLLFGLGLVFLPLRRQRWLGMGMCLVCCSLLLTSCNPFDGNDNEEDTFTFTVAVPAQGLIGQGDTSGPFTAPAVPITGATVRLTQ